MTTVFAIALLAILTNKPIQKQANTSDAVSVRKFVQAFYDWYSPRGDRTGREDLLVPDLGPKNVLLSDDLQQIMRQDRAAQQRVKLLKIGLYLDPFLSWIDPPAKYQAEKVEQKSDAWLVDVKGVVKAGNPAPHLTAKVKESNRGLVFADFVYDEGGSFLSKLRDLRNSLEGVQSYFVKPLQPSSPKDEKSVRTFVQSFYNWYADSVAAEFDNHNIDVEKATLDKKPPVLSAELHRLLLADRIEQQHSDYIVGPDMDVFLSSQDPNRHYRVHDIEHRGYKWFVSVRGVPTRDFINVSQVVAIVEKSKHGWRFTNFIYEFGDLLEMLRQDEKDRLEQARKRSHARRGK